MAGNTDRPHLDRRPRPRRFWQRTPTMIARPARTWAAWLGGLYLAASIVWILGSDRLLHLLASDATTLTALRSVMGLAFVGATALFIFWAVRHELARRHGTEQILRNALARERQLTRRLQGLDEMQNEFLVGVSHEVRTPLTSILGFARTLREHNDTLSAEDRAAHLDAVLRGVDRLEQQMERLLDAKRLHRTFDRPDYERVDLVPLARGVAEATQTPEHPVSVEDGTAVVLADPQRIRWLLENLIDNIARHTPVGTPAHIRFVDRPGEVELRITDDGPGIPDGLKPFAFRAFERGDGNQHAPGLGLGLFLVERYAQQHGGSVRAEDDPSGGTCIRVVLPKEPFSVSSAGEPPDVPAEERGERTSPVERLAERAGLRADARLGPGALARRRREIAGVVAAAAVALPTTITAILLGGEAGWISVGALPVLRVALVLLGPAVALYAIEKERAVRRLERTLADEGELRRSLEGRLRRLLEQPDEDASTGGPPPTGSTAFRRVAEEALTLLGGDHASLLAVRTADLLVVAEAGHSRDLVGRHGSFERGIAGFVARTGRPVLLRDDMDVMDLSTDTGTPFVREGAPPLSSVCAPLRLGDELVAVLNVNVLDGPRRFDGGDLRLLTIFAEQAEGLLPTAMLTDDARAETSPPAGSLP